MSHTVYLPKENIRFQCEPGETILDAAWKAGYELPSSCRAGVCASCKGRILSGQIRSRGSNNGLTQSELLDGYSLFCQAVPETDIEVEAYGVRPLEHNSTTRLSAKINKIERLVDDVSLLQLRFPAGKRVTFQAGQYLQLILKDGSRRNYSMANPPYQNDGVQLHIRHVPDGYVSGLLQHSLRRGDVLDIELPMGDFYLRESNNPLIFLVSGTGFAPVKSILEMMIRRKEMNRPIRLYWGGRRQQDIYMAELPKKWEQQHPNFKFIPVLSAETNGCWRTGYVHEAVAQDFSDMQEVEVYACGSPAMITAARSQFIKSHALPPEAFYCDAFVASDLAAST